MHGSLLAATAALLWECLAAPCSAGLPGCWWAYRYCPAAEGMVELQGNVRAEPCHKERFFQMCSSIVGL